MEGLEKFQEAGRTPSLPESRGNNDVRKSKCQGSLLPDFIEFHNIQHLEADAADE